MSQPCSTTSRPYNRWVFIGLPIGLGLLMLLPAVTRLDFALAELFYVPGDGFIGRHSAFIEDWLHDRAKQLVIILGVLVIAGFIGSLCLQRLCPWRRRLGYLVLAMALSTSFVNPLKTLTRMHCPWSLSEFGGVEQFSELLAPPALRQSRKTAAAGREVMLPPVLPCLPSSSSGATASRAAPVPHWSAPCCWAGCFLCHA